MQNHLRIQKTIHYENKTMFMSKQNTVMPDNLVTGYRHEQENNGAIPKAPEKHTYSREDAGELNEKLGAQCARKVVRINLWLSAGGGRPWSTASRLGFSFRVQMLFIFGENHALACRCVIDILTGSCPLFS